MPSKETIFKTLNQTCVAPNVIEPTLFPDTETQPTTDSWYYSDLHNLFGETLFPTQPSFSAHIWQNLVMPTDKNQKRGTPQLTSTDINFYNDHITQITHPYTLDAHHYKNAKDFKLSRYACWCMSRNNPNMVFSRTYFISPVIDPQMDFPTMNAWCYQFARVNLREQLTKYEKIINAIAHKNKINFNEFRRLSRAALFGNSNKSHITERNDFYISHNTPLADHMGAATLYARIHALKDAITKINHTQPIYPNKILEIIFTELNNARINMIKNQHIHPENDIIRLSAPQIQSKLMRTERDFINQYAFQKTR